MILSISGPPGSGKTTLAEIISERLGLELILTGRIFRDMAAQREMSLSDFGAYAEEHPEVDIELDRRVVDAVRERAEQGKSLLVEGRLAGFMLYRANIPSFKIYVTASQEVRAERIRKREGGDIAEIMHEMAAREECERERYLSVYSFDIRDMSIYDLVLDSSDMGVEEVAARVLTAVEEWSP